MSTRFELCQPGKVAGMPVMMMIDDEQRVSVELMAIDATRKAPTHIVLQAHRLETDELDKAHCQFMKKVRDELDDYAERAREGESCCEFKQAECNE